MRRLLSLAAALVATGVSAQPALQPLGTYSTGRFDEGAAEIVAYDAATQRAFFVNADAGQVQALDLSDPAAPTLALTISDFAGTPNSVAVRGGFIAVAVEAPVSTDPGEVRFYTTDGAFVQAVTVGALPDAVAVSEDGRYVVVANEGEPADGVDPEGTISVIDVADMTLSTVRFTDFDRGGPRFGELDGSVLLDPAAPSVAQDLEPEFVAISGTTAYVTLQEANAVAVVDLPSATLVGVYGLGLKDYGAAGNGIDPSDRDGGIDIRPVPVLGARQPDAIAAFEEGGVVYLVTANEGDARDGDEARVRDLALDPAAFPNAADLQTDGALGRLEVRPSAGDLDGDGDQDRLVAFGGRSFTVYAVRAGGVEVVFDSGDAFERITADRLPADFNADNDENGSFDSRSDAKGPEPEGVALGVVDGRRYAFVGLERIGGVMTYDLTDPAAPTFVDYVNNRDFSVEAQLADGSTNPAVGDLGPEGIAFVPAAESPTGAPLVLLSNEVSGTVTAYAVGGRPATPLSPASPFAFGAFDADGEGDGRGEVVEIVNTSADLSLALSGGTFVVFDPFSERVSYAAPLDAVVEPGATFALATSGGDLDLPAGTLPDGPGAFALVQGVVRLSARPCGTCSGRSSRPSSTSTKTACSADARAGRASARTGFDLADALRQAALGADEPVDLALTTAPEPDERPDDGGVRARRGRSTSAWSFTTRSAAAWPSSSTARSGRGGTT